MPTFADRKIQAFAGPMDPGACDELERAIVDFIGGATSSLDITSRA